MRNLIEIFFQISKKKRKAMYKSKSCNEFDKAEMILYEEVTKMPPFRRKTLVLVGVQGVGRRTLKSRLINSDTNKFGTIIPRKRVWRHFWRVVNLSSPFRHNATATRPGGERSVVLVR